MIKQIRLIEIELFSYCNRTCSFCPNSFIDRLSFNELLDIKIFKKIIKELKSVIQMEIMIGKIWILTN